MAKNYLKTLKNNWIAALIIVLSGVVLSLALSFIQPILYSSTIRLLIIQKSANLDPYTAIKSAERIGENLSQIIYTSTFFEKVVNSGFDIDASLFSKNENKKRKQWREMVDTTVSRGTGLLEIEVYHKDKEQATQIANAIAFVLTTEGWQYIGSNLQIRLVDEPLESRFPVKPDFLLNGSLGLVFGLFLAGGYVFWKAEGKKKLKIVDEIF